jgi:hypothetical protein
VRFDVPVSPYSLSMATKAKIHTGTHKITKKPRIFPIICCLVFGFLGIWITFGLQPKITDYLYIQTGIGEFEKTLDKSTFMFKIISILVFYILCFTIYLILKVNSNKYISLGLTFLFVTSPIVIVVFLSAPIYNLLSRLFILVGLIFVYFSIFPKLEPKFISLTKVFLFTSLAAYFYVINRIMISFITNNYLDKNVFTKNQIYIIIFLLSLLLLVSLILIYFFLIKLKYTELYFIAISLCLLYLFILDSEVGQTRIFNIFFYIPFFLIVLFSRLEVRLSTRISTFIFLTLSTTVVWIRNQGLHIPLTFYPSTGLQNSSLLLGSSSPGPGQLGIPFEDVAFSDFSFYLEAESGAWGGLWSMFKLFAPNIINNLFTNIEFIFQGAFEYLDPIGLFPLLIHDLLNSVTNIISPFTYFCGLIAPLVLLFRTKRLGMTTLILLLTLLFLPMISRISIHQYWFFPLYGLWALSFITNIVYIRIKDTVRNEKSFGSTYLSARNFSLMLFLACLLIGIFTLNLNDIKLRNAISNSFLPISFQNEERDRLVKKYSRLPKTLLASASSINNGELNRMQFKVPISTNLIYIKSSVACTLKSVQFVLISSGENIPIRLALGNSSSREVYIPLIYRFENNVSSFEILHYKGCQIQVYKVDTNKLKAPLFALIPETEISTQMDKTIITTNSTNSTSIIQLNRVYDEKVSKITTPKSDFLLNFEGRLIPLYDLPPNLKLKHFETKDNLIDLSTQVLGATAHGRFARDIWKSKPFIPAQNGSLRIKGEVVKGTIVFGVSYGLSHGTYNFVPHSIYNTQGSNMGVNSNKFDICLPLLKDVMNTTFIGGIADQYSITWMDVSIQPLVRTSRSCFTDNYLPNWNHTL